jgi:hypothetical protein
MNLLRFRQGVATYVAYWNSHLDALEVVDGTLMATIYNPLTHNAVGRDIHGVLDMEDEGVDYDEYVSLSIEKQYEIALERLRNLLKTALQAENDYPRERGSRRAKNELNRVIKNLG